ncbi:endonuclease domain-containing protein, partial [Acinetobacter baumannii]
RREPGVERKLWSALRNRQLENHKFRFQATIGTFVVDFLCVEKRLVVELDGSQHSEEGDRRRTAYLEAQGYVVMRFWNSDLVENFDGVVEAIRL